MEGQKNVLSGLVECIKDCSKVIQKKIKPSHCVFIKNKQYFYDIYPNKDDVLKAIALYKINDIAPDLELDDSSIELCYKNMLLTMYTSITDTDFIEDNEGYVYEISTTVIVNDIDIILASRYISFSEYEDYIILPVLVKFKKGVVESIIAHS